MERNSSTGTSQSQNDNHMYRDSHTSSSKSTPARKIKHSEAFHGPVPATIDKNCPMIVLSESLPEMDGMTYVTENDSVTYFAINGNGFELYVATGIETLFCLFFLFLTFLFVSLVVSSTLFPSNQTPLDICARRKLHLIHITSTRATMMTMTTIQISFMIKAVQMWHRRQLKS